ncbi:MAG: peptidase [Sphingomonas bacterium]|uniref:M1 family metallopeptidase n=1 Tax=Sphingomonas bacterium TaxID=1895847 RepID=UPI0026158272|nr:M1 family metallopeptidase [Sphingomonas bacterium]MDB5696204.1 peptidase [Sphingomonas bacterium]
MKSYAVALALTVSAPALAVGQLPRDVVPVSYDISVSPDAKTLAFKGQERIAVDVREATRTVTLNAADLDITTATWDGKAVPVKLDADAQLLTVTLPAPATPGRHTLGFEWRGKINRSAAGLFAIDYTNADGTPARMLATQFEAPDARRFAPMWDEPAFKARFTLSTVAPAGQLAVSNMPVASITKNGDGTQLYRFGESPVMSSYLLFLGMGDLERKTVMAGKTEIGVVTRRGVSAQGDYALAEGKRLLAYFNDYFGQPYPLPKLDMIAGPGSSQFFGAMENWGAIFYFENELLVDPVRTSQSGRERIFTVVAHEIAHQWFGDLVTMQWWDDLWLNEGFASWMEGRASADLNPSWGAEATEVTATREGAMSLDATAATHPVIRPIENVTQISEAFDSITYLKGQAVIGMLESTLGRNKFRDGIRRYMAKYKYGNTVTDQLWAELAAASGRPVAEIASGFTRQGGVPLITVAGATCRAGTTTARLSQGRFGLDAASKATQTWQVPLVLATVGGARATTTSVSGPAPQAVSVRGCGPLVVNSGQGSYARVQYDEPGHAALVRGYQRLPLLDRLGLMGDDFALAAGGYQDLSRYFAVTGQVRPNADAFEWASVAGGMSTLRSLFRGTPLLEPLRARTRASLGPVLGRIGWEQRTGEPARVTNLRETLVASLGAAGEPDVVARARRYVAGLAADPTAIPPAIRSPILSTFAINSTAADWDQLLALTEAERSPVAKNRFVVLLGVARDEAVARRALALLRTDKITPPQKASLLRSLANAHPDVAFDWAVANRTLVDSFVEESSRAGFIPSLGAGSTNPAMPAKINALAEQQPAAARGGAMRALTAISVRKAAADQLRPATARWLGVGG